MEGGGGFVVSQVDCFEAIDKDVRIRYRLCFSIVVTAFSNTVYSSVNLIGNLLL